MKIRKLFLSLLLSGVTLGSAAAQSPMMDPASATSASASRASRHIGDAVPAAAASGGQNNFRTVQYDMSMQELAPGATSYDPGSVSFDSGYGSSCGDACGSSYGTSCGTSCGGSGNLWFGAETLLWWGQKRDVPPLLTTAAQGVLPVAGAQGVTTVVGGPDNGIDNGLLPGYRLSGGMYFGCEKQIGISGRVFGIYRANDTTTRTSDGLNSSVGVPFFNTVIGQPDSLLVAFNNGAPFATGSASVNSKLSLLAAEPSLRVLVSGSNDHHIDLLGGYTYLKLKDSLNIATNSVDTDTGNLVPDGTIFQTNDLFSGDNQFHGGHLCLESTVKRQRISLTTLTKVSFGNMRQSGLISGSTNVTQPNGAPALTPGGIFAQQSNIGTVQRDAFAFIPELGVKGGLCIRKNLSVSAGYTFLYVSKVALAGNQIDSNLDLTQVQGGAAGVQPAANFRDGSMWFQGVDLGLNWTF
ncbi:MAG: BBP7 family outer membrane beta-barrel protein [Pirellulaceae bacterium]|nr:BBP7 family outer membrane beta-barrel protein [Pirellulaceae bacterium]